MRSSTTGSFTIEAFGLRLSVNFFKDLGITKVEVEGDALQVVSSLQHDKIDQSQGGCLIQDARCLLNSFAIWSIKHVYRKANVVAHKLVKNSLSLEMDRYDIEMVPHYIW